MILDPALNQKVQLIQRFYNKLKNNTGDINIFKGDRIESNIVGKKRDREDLTT